MDIGFYFEPIDPTLLQLAFDRNQIGYGLDAYTDKKKFPSLAHKELAIIGIREDRGAINNQGCGQAPEEIRKYLYKLFKGNHPLKIVDLGDIHPGYNLDDTYFAVSEVITALIRADIVPIIIGGTQDITYANYLAYVNLGQIINIAHIDSTFDLGLDENHIDAKSYLNTIITHQPNYLFNYTNIGYQTYFVDQEAVDLMNNLYFDAYRLGNVQADMEEVEPIIRNADCVSIDISAARFSDAPGNGNATPNGFYGEEMCQIARYAGISDKLSSVGFYEFNPLYDRQGQTAHLIAQMIWYFIDGFYSRKHDYPYKDKESYLKYVVQSTQFELEQITFYKSKKSDRWWMEVPCPPTITNKYKRHYLVPCSYADYQTACNQEIPERWFKVYQKLI